MEFNIMNHSLVLALSILCLNSSAQHLNYDREKWLNNAEILKPELKENIVDPVSLVEIVKDSDSFQGWKAIKAGNPNSLYNQSFKEIASVIIDFGDHYTGHFTMDLEMLSGTSDAPTRFKLTFGEVPSELATPFDPYPGTLSRAWLQDEVITVMSIPCKVKLDRRVSFRFLKIELLGASKYFDFKIAGMSFISTSSATNEPRELESSASNQIKNVDRISQKTLKECMQTVFEDGPKRDRRLWVGDLYLQSLANAYSFENHKLTQRCLYLLAGLSDQEGYILATAFESPKPHAKTRLMDYSLLFNATLLEYLKASNDTETAKDLWPVALKQLDIIKEHVNDNGIVDYESASNWWLFFDWKAGLNKEVSIQGLMIFTLKQSYELATILNKKEDVAYIPELIDKMSLNAMKSFFNEKTGMFESGDKKQISYASQIWMILAGVLSEKQSQKALRALENVPEALYPGGPYMYHYYIQALINSKMNETAKSSLIDYWGGMINKGADTFWEVYDPIDDFTSPYNFYPVNSYCHAWSCTPTYFIRKYPEIFQR